MAISGCAGEDPDENVDDAEPSDDADAGGDAGNGTAGGGDADPVDPAGNVTGSDNGTLEVNSAPVPAIAAPKDVFVNAPITVNLTADDAEGDALSWTLALDGVEVANGTDLPAAHSQVFAETGSHRFVFNVTDGDLDASANLTLDVIEPEPVLVIAGASSAPINPLSGGVPLASNDNGLGARSCAGFVAGENGVECYFEEVPADLAGHSWISSDVTTVEFWDACDATGEATQRYTHDNAGTIPEGTGCAVLWYWGAGSSSDLRVEIY